MNNKLGMYGNIFFWGGVLIWFVVRPILAIPFTLGNPSLPYYGNTAFDTFDGITASGSLLLMFIGFIMCLIYLSGNRQSKSDSNNAADLSQMGENNTLALKDKQVKDGFWYLSLIVIIFSALFFLGFIGMLILFQGMWSMG